jgi:glutaredoxin
LRAAQFRGRRGGMIRDGFEAPAALPSFRSAIPEGDETMSIKLHRCRFTFLRSDRFECARVQNALDEQGIDYEVVKSPYFPRSRRKEVERLTGQRLLPVIEFEDGSAYREESADMAATIRSGQLDTKRAPAPSSAAER